VACDRWGAGGGSGADRRWLWQQQFEQHTGCRDGHEHDQLNQLGQLELGIEHRVDQHFIVRA
jgi:hypothetical protein